MADEIVGYVKHILGGIQVNADTLSLDDIDKTGPRGNHLASKKTFAEFRKFWMPSLFDRTAKRPADFPPFQERLNAKAKEIIETHEVPPLADDKRMALLELEKKWMK